MRWLCYTGAIVCTALYTAQFFHDIFICIPVQKNYNPKLPGHCLPSRVGGSVTAIFNVITDLYILILPLPFVWSLHMKLGPKLRLTALFGLGILYDPPSSQHMLHCQSISSTTNSNLIKGTRANTIICKLQRQRCQYHTLNHNLRNRIRQRRQLERL